MTKETDKRIVEAKAHFKHSFILPARTKELGMYLLDQLEQERELSEKVVEVTNREIMRLEQQVNTLTEATQIAIYELGNLERNLNLPERGYVRNLYNAIVRTLTESLPSIKDATREEQTE